MDVLFKIEKFTEFIVCCAVYVLCHIGSISDIQRRLSGKQDASAL